MNYRSLHYGISNIICIYAQIFLTLQIEKNLRRMKNIKNIIIYAVILLVSSTTMAQLENMRLNGYVQTDFELAGKDGQTYLGPAYSKAKDGDVDYFFRYGVYRGLIRATFEKDKGSGALEINVTEAGVIPLVAFLQFDPYSWLSFQGGLLNVDYGFELMYPSSLLETVERTNYTRLLFPKEHDLGFKFTLSYPFKEKNKNLSFSFGMMSGNGINKIADKNMNFLSHLKYDYKGDVFSLGLGASYYEGSTNNADTLIYKVNSGVWQAEEVQANQKNTRRYVGFEFQLGYHNILGLSSLRGEATFGKQPSRQDNFASQDGNSYNQNDAFSYQRNFLGYYLCYIQKFEKLPLSFVAKYSYFDKNTDLSASQVNNWNDLAMHDLGLGVVWEFNKHIKALLFYDKILNETNTLFKQLNDDVVHLRLQYKF